MKTLACVDVAVPAIFAADKAQATSDQHPDFVQQTIHITDGVIRAVNSQRPKDAATVLDGSGYIALPGFIDLHVHGSMGVDTMDASQAALQQMGHFFATHGVTAYCPTTMTAPHADILKAVRAIGMIHALADEDKHGPRILGAHVEGPYISPRFPGAQPAEHVRRPNLLEFRQLLEAGPISLITLAPEMSNAHELVMAAREAGVVVVLGHTDASYEECMTAVSWGVSQATHTYNAMSGLHHRWPGTLGAVLSCDEIDAQLIADNVHVHPAAMQILARCKGVDGTILITDAMQAAGLNDGEYALGGQRVTVVGEECRLADGTLAGSILTMEKALKNFMAATGLSLAEAWPTSSQNAARSLGLDDRLGAIRPGYWADLVVLDSELEVVATIVRGQIVYQRSDFIMSQER